ncbi:MAG: TRAP transporter TatT component family protein [Syntrophobacterales bacterium]
MKSPASLIIIAMLGIALLAGDSVSTLGGERPKFIKEQVVSLKPTKYESFSLKPIIGLAEAQRQVLWYKQHIPKTGNERSVRLSYLARLYIFLGEEGDQKTRKNSFEQGDYYAGLLIKEQPQRVEGHYWLALNLCGLADVTAPKQSLTLVPRIIKLLEATLTIDEAYDQAGAHRVLGRIYFMAPAWPLSEGDVDKSFRHLAAAVAIAPENSTNHLFFAETLHHMGKGMEANRELEKVLVVTKHALWPQGLADDQKKAQELMKKYKTKGDIALISR